MSTIGLQDYYSRTIMFLQPYYMIKTAKYYRIYRLSNIKYRKYKLINIK